MEKSIKQIKTELHKMFPQYSGFIEHTLVAKMCKEYHESELKKLRVAAVIKNEVAVCPECGCNKVHKMAGDNYSCMNAYCEWQTVL